MIKNRHNTRVRLGISSQGTFSSLTSILEVPEVLDGRCKPRTWHTSRITHRFQMDKQKLQSHEPCSPGHKGLDSAQRDRFGASADDPASPKAPPLRGMGVPPPLRSLTALPLTYILKPQCHTFEGETQYRLEYPFYRSAVDFFHSGPSRGGQGLHMYTGIMEIFR